MNIIRINELTYSRLTIKPFIIVFTAMGIDVLAFGAKYRRETVYVTYAGSGVYPANVAVYCCHIEKGKLLQDVIG